jgi:hypothetical protein
VDSPVARHATDLPRPPSKRAGSAMSSGLGGSLRPETHPRRLKR